MLFWGGEFERAMSMQMIEYSRAEKKEQQRFHIKSLKGFDKPSSNRELIKNR